MLVAVDIDGTLSKYPTTLGNLIRSLHNNYHCVILLTGAITDKEEITTNPESRCNQVRELIGENNHTIIQCQATTHERVAQMKAGYCRTKEVDMLIDDDPLYCETCKRASPNTLVLKVVI